MPHKYKAVIFDWDGTIVDSLDFVFNAHNHVRNLHGLPLWSRDDFKVNMKYSSREIYPKIYGDKAPEAVAALVKYTEENYQKFIVLFKGAQDFLDRLKAAGTRLAVVSNMRPAALAQQIAMLKLEGYFAVVAGSGYADRDKPDGAPLLKALTEMNLSPSEDILYVGDTETDLLCARDARCDVAYINHGGSANNHLIEQYKPEFVVNTIEDLSEKLFMPANSHKAAL